MRFKSLSAMVAVLGVAAFSSAGPRPARPVASAPSDAGSEAVAVRQAVLDYAEGYYEQAPERMTRAISPLLTKRAWVVRPGASPFLAQMNAEMLIEATRGNAQRPSPAERQMSVEALDVTGDLASARVFSVLFNDYAHLVKRDGRWQLVSVLWHVPPAAADASQVNAVEQASRDYAAAVAGDDPQRVSAVLSPVAAIRTLVATPSGARILRDQVAEAVVAAVAAGKGARGNPKAAVTVLGVDADIASAKLGSGPDTTYLHLALQRGRWIVVNTLNARG